MKKKKKKMLLILILVAIVIIAIVYAVTRPNEKENPNVQNTVKEEFVQQQQDGTKVNVSNKLKEEKEIDGLKIGNIQLTEKNGQSVLLATVTNSSSRNTEAFLVDIILYDKTGNQIAKIPGVVSGTKAGQSVELRVGITEDYANAYDFKIVKK